MDQTQISKEPMSLEAVLSLVQGSLAALHPQDQEKARRLIAESQLTRKDTLTACDDVNQDVCVQESCKQSSVSSTVSPPEAVETMDVVDSTQPKKPLSAYNVFFQMERKRILERCENGDEATDVDFTKRESYTFEKVVEFALSQRKEQSTNEPKPKRRHRKTHGKIGFADLARTIASNWKAMPADERVIFQDYFEVEQNRYRSELAHWAALQSKKDSSVITSSAPTTFSEESSRDEGQDNGNVDSCDTTKTPFLNDISTSDRTLVTRGSHHENHQNDTFTSQMKDTGSAKASPQFAYQSMHSALQQEKAKQVALLRTMKQQIAQQQRRLQEKNERIRKQMLLIEQERELEMMNQLQGHTLPRLGSLKNDPAFLAGLRYAQMHSVQQPSNFPKHFGNKFHSAPLKRNSGMQSSLQEPIDEQQLLDFDLNTINNDDYTNDDEQNQPVYDLVDRSFQNVYEAVHPVDDFGGDTASLDDFLPCGLTSNNDVMLKMLMMNQGVQMNQRFNPMVADMNNFNNAQFRPQQQLQGLLQRQRMHQAAVMQRQLLDSSTDDQQMLMMLRQRQQRQTAGTVSMAAVGGKEEMMSSSLYNSNNSINYRDDHEAPYNKYVDQIHHPTTSVDIPMHDTSSAFVLDED